MILEIKGKVQTDIMDWVMGHPRVCEDGEARRSYFSNGGYENVSPTNEARIVDGSRDRGFLRINIPQPEEVWGEILIDVIEDWESHLYDPTWLIIDDRTGETLTTEAYAQKACKKLKQKVKDKTK